MNTEKIEKLKKGLTNSQIPENLKQKIREQIQRLEAEDKQSQKVEEEIKEEIKEQSKPVAKTTSTRKPRTKKSVAKKPVAKKTSTRKPSQTTAPKRTAMSLAKEIRKEGESWNEARARASKIMKEKTHTATKDVESELDKLIKLVQSDKYNGKLKGFSDSDLKRDASRKAKPRGARKVTHSGETSNQYGTFKNNLGRKYYESRDKHADRLSPRYPKNAPLLAEGGYLTDPTFGNFQNQVFVNGGFMDGVYDKGGETYNEKASKLKGGVDYYSVDIDLDNGDEIRDLSFKSLDKAKKEYLKYSESMVYDDEDIMDVQLLVVYKNGDYDNIYLEEDDNYAKGGGIRRKNGQTYDFGSAWTNDHNQFDKGADHEVNYRRKRFATGGELKKGDIIYVDMGYGNGVERVQLMNDFKAGISGIKFISLKTLDKNSAPYTITQSRLSKVIVNKDSFELGGVMATDLAGHTGGGTGGLNAGMPLDGFSNTAYTGLVGETGAMSSGEMFMNGGGVKNLAIEDLPNDSSSKQVKYWASYIVTTETEDNEKINSLASIMDDLKLYSNVFFEDGFACLGFNFKGTKQQLKDNLVELATAMKKMNVRGKLDLLNETSKEVYDNLSSGEMFANGGGVDGKEVIKLKVYGYSGNVIREGDFLINYNDSTITFPSGKTFKVVEDREYTFKIQKTQIKANRGIKGLSDFLNEINTPDTPFKGMAMNLIDLGKDGKYEAGGGLPNGSSQSYMVTEAFGNPAQHYANGGGLPSGAEQSYVNYYLGEGSAQGIYAKGGGVRRKNGQTYDFGSAWTNDHNQFDKGADHEVDYRKKKSLFNKGGGVEKKYNSMPKEDKETLMEWEIGVGRMPFNQYEKYNQLTDHHKDLVNRHFSKKTKSLATGGGVDSPSIYVADLEAYNNGVLQGEWLDLSNYSDAGELMEAIQELLDNWGVEEYAIHDAENIPSGMYSEYMGESDFEELYEMMELANDNDLPLPVVQDVVNAYGTSAVSDFIGKYDSADEFARQLVDDMGGIENFNNFEQYLSISSTDRRLLAQEMADNYVQDIEYEDGGNRLIEEAGLDVEEYEEADSDRQEEMLEEAKEIVYDKYYDQTFDELADPYSYFVEEQGLYSVEDFANANFVNIDYEDLGDDLEQDYAYIYYDSELYVFNVR